MTGASTFPPSAAPPWRQPLIGIVRRDFRIRRSYRVAFLLDILFALANLLIYYFISKTFSGATTANLGPAPSYFAFALVGMALTVVVQAATTELGSSVRVEQLTGTLETLVTQPVSSTQIALGMAALPFLYATARLTIYFVFASLWLDVDLGNASWSGFVLVLASTAAAMTALGIASSALVLLVKRGELVISMLILAMGLAGGAFFPVSVLPHAIRPIAHVIPMRYAYDGARRALFAGSGWHTDVLALVLFACVALPLSLLLFRGALNVARRMGTLGQY